MGLEILFPQSHERATLPPETSGMRWLGSNKTLFTKIGGGLAIDRSQQLSVLGYKHSLRLSKEL